MWFSQYLFRGTQAQARSRIQDIVHQQWHCIVSFVYFAQAMKFNVYQNSHIDMDHIITSNKTEQQYLQALQHADIVCIDGIAMQIFDRVWQCFFKAKRQRTTNLNGTDFLPYILSQTAHQKVWIIMSTVYDPNLNKWPEWMDKWLQKIKTLYPHIDVVFAHQTTFQDRWKAFPFKKLQKILTEVRDQYDHILFLNGIGGPAQEIRTHEHKDFFADRQIIILNNGATLDYYSGFETRAPKRVVKARIGETLWRIIVDPKKNLRKSLAMFRIIPYRYRCLHTYIFKKKS